MRLVLSAQDILNDLIIFALNSYDMNFQMVIEICDSIDANPYSSFQTKGWQQHHKITEHRQRHPVNYNKLKQLLDAYPIR